MRNEQCQRGERSIPHIPRIARAPPDHTKCLHLVHAIDLGLLLVLLLVARNIAVLVANDQCWLNTRFRNDRRRGFFTGVGRGQVDRPVDRRFEMFAPVIFFVHRNVLRVRRLLLFDFPLHLLRLEPRALRPVERSSNLPHARHRKADVFPKGLRAPQALATACEDPPHRSQ
jgi:hypothetical protein